MAENTTQISVQLGPAPAQEFRDLTEYAIDSSVLTLMDTATVTITNPAGARALTFQAGDPARIYMRDRNVSGGDERQILKGVIIETRKRSDASTGTVVQVTIGDLGWHLVNNCGPLFKSVMNMQFRKFLELILERDWDFAGVDVDNAFNRRLLQGLKLNQSRQAIAAARAPVDVFIPPVCFEAGEYIADKLITYARRAKYLVNVSGDGYLQIFQPDYTTPIGFTLHYHKPSEVDRKRNNLKEPIEYIESIDGLYTDTICVGTVPVPSVLPDRFNPHRGTFQGKHIDASVLPYKRLLTFSEGDALTQQMADDRALWKFQRGQFDSWVAHAIVEGHAMNGAFITPDTMCGIEDTVAPFRGNAYISARRFIRNLKQGTVTHLELRKPNFLRA